MLKKSTCCRSVWLRGEQDVTFIWGMRKTSRAAESGQVSTDTSILSGRRPEWAELRPGPGTRPVKLGECVGGRCRDRVASLLLLLYILASLFRQHLPCVYRTTMALLFFKVLFYSSKCCFEKNVKGFKSVHAKYGVFLSKNAGLSTGKLK